MRGGAQQTRLALTVFDQPASLFGAVLALLQEGTLLEQICLVALASTMKRIRRLAENAETEWSRLSALTKNVVDWPGAPLGRRVVATSSPPVADLAHLLDGEHISRSHVHHPGDDGHSFSEHIAQGAIALIVGSATAAQQARSTRILLAQSAHGVKTYEFSAPKFPGI